MGAGPRPGCAWVASFATDTPFFPDDLVARLLQSVCAGECRHRLRRFRWTNASGLRPLARGARCGAAPRLTAEGVRKIDAWTARYRVAIARFPSDPYDPFFNVNEAADLQKAEALLPLATHGAR